MGFRMHVADAVHAVSSTMIVVQDVTYDYPGHRALDGVGFELPAASITALVGPNGAGKTTLLRTMAALEEPMEGHIFMNGLDIWETPRAAHRIMGYLPDHFGLYKDLSVRCCLLHAACARNFADDEAEEAVQWAARQVALEASLDDRAGTLSRGQRQRLALAQAIVHRPMVLLLDEPASGLDPQARADLSRLMKNLAAAGMTLLISSHILAELEDYCTAMLVLEQGRLLSHRRLETAHSNTSDIPSERTFRLRLAAGTESDLACRLSAWLSERHVRAEFAGEAVWTLTGVLDEAAQARLLRELASTWDVLEFMPQTRNLQEMYLQAFAARESGV
ncbi:MAG: ABC transporter ATP-binding protein [Zoogloeaceae bacterium]|jgi:ABC-2 type transport system ATP-binding protein|nr:ABC transporter ATP-binding protein [Zoogloeaceae bacterium]